MNLKIEPRLLLFDGGRDYRYVALSTIEFSIDYTSKIIVDCISACSDVFDYLVSTNGQAIKIKDLNCKSYDELLIALELHDLLYGLPEDAIDKSELKTFQKLFKENNELKKENEKLKKKLEKMKQLFND